MKNILQRTVVTVISENCYQIYKEKLSMKPLKKYSTVLLSSVRKTAIDKIYHIMKSCR